MAQEEPYECETVALAPSSISMTLNLFFPLLLVCVKGCDKAARHNKPSAQLTGASAETFTYDIVKVLCNQSLLIWDTIAFSRLRRPWRQPRTRWRKSHQIGHQRISKPIFYFCSSISRVYTICRFMGNSKQIGSAWPKYKGDVRRCLFNLDSFEQVLFVVISTLGFSEISKFAKQESIQGLHHVGCQMKGRPPAGLWLF